MQRFLFLQGPASPFFSRLADRLAAKRVTVYRVNFCAGDALYWRGKPAWNFQLANEHFGTFLRDKIWDAGVTDLVLFGDQRSIHRIAIEIAKQIGVRIHVFEEGYVRPGWITLERGGISAPYRLPRDPDWYLEASSRLPSSTDRPMRRATIGPRALHDMTYHAANVFNPMFYGGYRTHRPCAPALEYAGWARRYAKFPWYQYRDSRLIEKLVLQRTPYFVFPLQLNGDAQVTHRSPFADMRAALDEIVRSFALHAPSETHLLIKNHPLDTGFVDYVKYIRRLESELDVAGRLHYVETGSLPRVLVNARGVVTVNSTVGMAALDLGRPVKALGTAIYDIRGLASQCAMDEFWNDPGAPDPEVAWAFRAVVIHSTQLRGELYSASGITTAVQQWPALLEPHSRLEMLLERTLAART